MLKDQKNPGSVLLLYRSSFTKELENTGAAEILCSQDLDECGTESVVRLTVVNPQFEQPLARAIDKLIGAGSLTNLALLTLVGVKSHRLHPRNLMWNTNALSQTDSFGQRHRHRNE